MTAILKNALKSDVERRRRSGAGGRSLVPVLSQSLRQRAATRRGTALAHERLQ
jgi:hypothetical protein